MPTRQTSPQRPQLHLCPSRLDLPFPSSVGLSSLSRIAGVATIASALLLVGVHKTVAQSAPAAHSAALLLSDSPNPTESFPARSTSTPGAAALTSTMPASMVEPVPVPIDLPADLSANPGRPAMATSALLTPLGYAQIENGLLYAAGSAQFSRRTGLEQTVRLTVAPRLQFILAAEPTTFSVTSTGAFSQCGDIDGGLQVVALPGHGLKPTLSLGYLRLVRGGTATDLDIGGYANSAILMASADFGHTHVDANGFLNETEGPVRRLQFGQAVAFSRPFTPKLSGTAELRHFTEPLIASNGFSALFALGYAVHPNLVFDTGLVRGFSSSSTHWQIATGFTYVLPQRIWGFPRR